MKTVSDPLTRFDNVFRRLRTACRGQLDKNYPFTRYTESWTVCWWHQGLVKFIQLLQVPEERTLELWIGAYRLPVPLLNFWTRLLAVPSDFSKRLTALTEDVPESELETWLKTAREEVVPLNRRSVQPGAASRTVLKNLLGILSLIVLLGLIGAGVCLALGFPAYRALAAFLATLFVGGIFVVF